ncbi:MAG TPA: glycosyltransferase 87 family protein [Candidatus Elarobacter sp.]
MNGALVGVRIRTREETLRGARWPLRPLLWTWAGAVAVAIASACVWSVQHGGGDWRVFAAAGARAGTPALIDAPEAWQAFFYLPGAAWALTAVARIPLAASFALNAVVMLACAAVAGLIAARVYGLRRADAVATFLLWPPVVYAAAIAGQNAPLGVLLAQLAVAGFAARSVVLTAVPVGLLLYKPTYALPFVALLVLRRSVRELSVVAAVGAAWYAASVAATGGDWAWPLAWCRLIARFAAGDIAHNAPFAIGLPGVLAHAGASTVPIAAVVVCVTVACAAAFRRVGATEAAGAACLAGLALSPHAWAYDAVLALPMIACVTARLGERRRTRLLLALWLVAPLFFLSPLLGFDPLALVVSGGTLAWLAWRLLGPSAALTLPVSER